jgi:2'-5' RNA ligase
MNIPKISIATLTNASWAVTVVIALSLVGCSGSNSTKYDVASNHDELGYSIWIMSDQVSQQVFYEKIKEISSTSKGATDPFLPHVTLIGQVQGSAAEVLDKTHSMAERVAPFRMHLLGFGITDERFKQLFIEIEPDRNMMMVRMLAEKTYAKTEPGEYKPHLSLAYGNIERDTKTRIISDAKGLLDYEFDAKVLAVVRTPEELKDWKMIGTFSLAKRQADQGH